MHIEKKIYDEVFLETRRNASNQLTSHPLTIIIHRIDRGG